MRSIICVVFLVSLIGLAGCGQPDATPADEPQTEAPAQVEHEPISEDDFESGEADGTLKSGGEDEGSETEGEGETP